MEPINIHEAKTHFSRLIERVLQGEELIIARAGKPVARLVPIEPSMPKRLFGALHEALPEILESQRSSPTTRSSRVSASAVSGLQRGRLRVGRRAGTIGRRPRG